MTIDLASDYVHSRQISGAIWMIIPAMLAMLFVPGKLKIIELPSSDLRPASIFVFNQPTAGSVLLGQVMQFPLKVLITNKHGFPIDNISLSTRILKATPSEAYNWCAALEVRKGTLEALALQDVCAISLAGAQASTNSDGVATFAGLHLKRGFPGNFRLQLALDWCEDTGCRERETELREKSIQDSKRVQIQAYTDLTVSPTPFILTAVNTAPAFLYLGVPVSKGGAASGTQFTCFTSTKSTNADAAWGISS